MTNAGDHTAAGAAKAHPDQSLHATSIRDVAAAAGVSTATVSRAVRGLPHVSQPTRQKILAAAANLGYVASSAASELARGRGTPRATLSEQLNRFEPPATNAARSPMADPFDASVHRPSASRGTILVVNGHLSGTGKSEERPAPAPAEIERLVQSVASAHGFTACIKYCNEAGMLDTVRAAAASAVGIVINTGGLSPASTELHLALASAHVPAVEIHINNDYYRREKINISPPPSTYTVVISGAGIHGYKLAIDYLSTAV